MLVGVWKILPAGQEPALLQVDLPAPVLELDQASSYLPSGAYTTFRTYQGNKALDLHGHLRRLVNSANEIGIPMKVNQALIRQRIRQVIKLCGVKQDFLDLRFRLILDLENEPGVIFIVAEPFTPLPKEYYSTGVNTISCTLKRQQPTAKLTRFIEQASSLRVTLLPGVNEALMVDDQGCILEGLSSNFFAVKASELHTAGEKVLMGITRSLMIESARRLKIRIHLQPVLLTEMNEIDEAFITSSSRGILPVAKIDQQRIGSGDPGKITQQLEREFKTVIQEKLKII